MLQLRIYVEQHPNEMYRTFHLSQPTFFKPFNKYGDASVPKKIRKLERKFLMLPHIQQDTTSLVGLKEIGIKLNPTYTWDECIAAVVDVIKKYYKTDDVLISVMDRNPKWDEPRREEEMY